MAFCPDGSKVLTDAFGVVAMVAMTPLITIQLLGFRSVVSKMMREKIAMRRILDENDDQIINFMYGGLTNGKEINKKSQC